MITQYKAADPLDPTSQAEYKLLAGGATRTWVGTEDAYNAEKNNIPNNTMICITDDNMDVDTYSTSEVKTNKVWIDGKPVYRKVLVLNQTISSDTTVPSTIPNNVSDYWINYGESYLVVPNTTARIPLIYAHPAGLSYQMAAWLSDKDTIALRFGSAQSINKMVAVLEYTKTTE